MRIIFIHGFGEDEAIFDKIAPAIAGEKLLLNVWHILGNEPRPKLNVLDFSRELVEKYAISKQDVIIGHSMGGWIAYHIKHLTDSPIVQIGSWTHPNRVISPIGNTAVLNFAVRNGLFFNGLMKRLLISKSYKNKPSKAIYALTFDRLIAGNKENVIKQLQLVLSPVSEKITAVPDLRIHAKQDVLIRYPHETFHEVSGDHFTLYTHPQEVYEPINAFLKNLK